MHMATGHEEQGSGFMYLHLNILFAAAESILSSLPFLPFVQVANQQILNVANPVCMLYHRYSQPAPF